MAQQDQGYLDSATSSLLERQGSKVERSGLGRVGSAGDLLWDGVFCSFDLAEELLRNAVVERELAVQHGKQHDPQGPHVAGLASVRTACGETKTITAYTSMCRVLCKLT